MRDLARASKYPPSCFHVQHVSDSTPATAVATASVVNTASAVDTASVVDTSSDSKPGDCFVQRLVGGVEGVKQDVLVQREVEVEIHARRQGQSSVQQVLLKQAHILKTSVLQRRYSTYIRRLTVFRMCPLVCPASPAQKGMWRLWFAGGKGAEGKLVR